MATLLYRWCKIAYTHPVRVLGAWLILLVVIGGLVSQNPAQLDSEFRVDGTRAQAAVDQLEKSIPEAAGGQGTMAFRAEDGGRLDRPSAASAVARAVDTIYDNDYVVDPRTAAPAGGAAQERVPAEPAATGGPQPLIVDGKPVPGVLLSPDRSAALVQFQFTDQVFSLPPGVVDEAIEDAEAAARPEVEALPGATLQQIPELFGLGEGIGLVVAGLVLIMTMGSAVAAGVPLVTALAGIGSGVGAAMVLSNVFDINSAAISLALMLGLAVGIDYALFIVNRQRRLILDHGLPASEAAARALGTAGSAVMFAGTTVIIALIAMVVVGIPVLTGIGLVAAGTVALSVAVALTALPALLGLLGERVCTSKASTRAPHSNGGDHRVANAWIGAVIKHPLVAVGLVVVVAGALAVPVMSMRLGLPGADSYSPGTPQREGYDVVADGFGEGMNGPLAVVATRTAGAEADSASVQMLVERVGQIDGVAGASLAATSADGSTAVIGVVPDSGPSTEETVDLVARIRDAAPAYESELGLDAEVTGVTALGIDTSEKIGSVLPTYLAVVVGLSLIVLLVVFRSIIIPIKATAGFLLSVGAAFGASTALFQWGWLREVVGLGGTGPILCVLPILVSGVLYGLAMDYQVFVVTSIREAHVHGHRGGEAVRRGFVQVSRVVAGAAVIMVAVFAGFGFNPDTFVKQMGFTLAVGVLVDSFLIRMTLVPAAISAIGERSWWMPSWLVRILPDLDAEGSRLSARLAEAESDIEPTPRPSPDASLTV